MRYRAIRLVAANLFNTSTIRLIASFSLMGTVFAGVAFGMTEYGDTARLIGAAIGGLSTVAYNIWKTTKQLSSTWPVM